jgi:hypothetical protein
MKYLDVYGDDEVKIDYHQLLMTVENVKVVMPNKREESVYGDFLMKMTMAQEE